MIAQDKVKELGEFIKANVSPILVDFLSSKDIQDAIIISANCAKEELMGFYLEDKYILPKWYKETLRRDFTSIVIIDNIDSISKEEQLKFIELLKYRQIYSNKLLDSTVIIITAQNINAETINSEIYSLVAHIRG